VAGSDILEGRGNMHPMTMQWHCQICQATNKCSSRDGKEPVSNALTMDKRRHLGVPLRQLMAAIVVESTYAVTVAFYIITPKIAIYNHLYDILAVHSEAKHPIQ